MTLCTNMAIDLGEAKCFQLEVIKAFQNRKTGFRGGGRKGGIAKLSGFFKVIYFRGFG